MANEISTYCKQLKELNHCTGCGGSYQQGTCIYCGNENEKIKDLSRQLEQELAKLPPQFFHENKIDENLTWLYCIRELEIPSVIALLKNSKYEETVSKLSEFTLEAYHEQMSLSPMANRNIAILMENRAISDSDNLVMLNYLMRQILLKKQDSGLTNEHQEQLFLSLTETLTKNILGVSGRTGFLTQEEEENTHGKNSYGNIYLSQSMIIREPYEALATICHEEIHTIQYKELKIEKRLSRKHFLQIQDDILSHLSKDYYDENYMKNSCEREAMYHQYRQMITYCASIGVEVPEEYKIKMAKFESAFEIFPRIRTYEGKQIDIDIIFDHYIQDHKEQLEDYPQLAFQYKVEANKVVPKTKEEMEEDYQKYQLGLLQWNGEQEEIKTMYQRRISVLSNQIEENNIRGSK